MNIIVTGASRGIGYHTCLELIKDNHSVIALARSIDKLEELRAASGSPLLSALTLDISTTNTTKLMAEIEKKFSGRVDVLINNAGLLINKPFAELRKDEWQEMYNTNLFAVVNLIKMLMIFMGRNAASHIVNISSMGGMQGTAKFKGLSAYSSSKAAIAVLTECLAEELKEKNIAVNCLALGSVNTEMFRLAFPGHNAGNDVKTMAAFISHFALNGHKWFNGKVIPVSQSVP